MESPDLGSRIKLKAAVDEMPTSGNTAKLYLYYAPERLCR
jgi:hypothetical protein